MGWVRALVLEQGSWEVLWVKQAVAYNFFVIRALLAVPYHQA